MFTEGLRGLCASLSQNAEAWQMFASSSQPDRLPIPIIKGLSDSIKAAARAEDPDPVTPSPSPSLASHRGSFLLLLLIKALCEDRLLGAIKRYIVKHLGAKFSPGSNDDKDPVASSGSLSQSALYELYHDSNPSTPIIFILSSGSDPSATLSKFGASLNREAGNRLHIISLGQGQGPIAESTLRSSIKNGDWVCLQVSDYYIS